MKLTIEQKNNERNFAPLITENKTHDDTRSNTDTRFRDDA